MATDGASCEPDLSRAPEDAAGAAAEAAVTEFLGRAGGECRRGLGAAPGSQPDPAPHPRGVP